MKIVVIHDRIPNQIRGGERVAIEIAKTLNASLYTSYIDTKYDGNVNIIPFKQDKYVNSWYHRLIRREVIETTLIPFDFEQLDLAEYDIVFSSAVLSRSYIPTIDQYTINYLHSPPRWLYDLHRVRINMLNPKLRLFAKFWSQWWRTWDLTVDKYIDKYIANSEVVQKRIKRYYNRESEVIYPPVYTKDYKWNNDERYFLSISGLYPEKRIDVLINAFRDTPEKELRIVGTGMNYKKLAKGCSNIKFLGSVPEEEKMELLSNCTALISIPMDEDFGIIPIESFASGKPVIGVKEGFTQYQINSYKNGIFVDEPTPLALAKVLKDFDRHDWDIKDIQASAKKYDVEIFRRKIKSVTRRIMIDE